jgi:hypothetical protein
MTKRICIFSDGTGQARVIWQGFSGHKMMKILPLITYQFSCAAVIPQIMRESR